MTEINLDDLTIKQAKQLAAKFAAGAASVVIASPAPLPEPTPVLVCTDKRGVVFGYTNDVSGDGDGDGDGFLVSS
jgi:hypothetical protein